MDTNIIKAINKINREELKYQKKIEHKRFYKANKTTFILLDILVAITIIINFGALVLTILMVQQPKYEYANENNLEIIYYESNPSQEGLGNFKTVEDVAKEVGSTEEQLQAEKRDINRRWGVLYQTSFWWALLISLYIIQRIRIYNNFQMNVTIFVIAFYFSLISYDFLNNFGLYLGKLLFGI